MTCLDAEVVAADLQVSLVKVANYICHRRLSYQGCRQAASSIMSLVQLVLTILHCLQTAQQGDAVVHNTS